MHQAPKKLLCQLCFIQVVAWPERLVHQEAFKLTSAMSPYHAISCALLLFASAACTTKPEPAPTVLSTYLSKHSDTSDLSKVFTLNSDIQGNGWVMRKGTKLTFNADGSALLETIVYAQDGLNLPNAVQLESIQYGADGNVQFSIPGNDVGHSLHLRHARRDYPYTVRFGYKRAYFEAITKVKFACRLLCEPVPPLASYASGK
jgi:hypothetical protein